MTNCHEMKRPSEAGGYAGLRAAPPSKGGVQRGVRHEGDWWVNSAAWVVWQTSGSCGGSTEAVWHHCGEHAGEPPHQARWSHEASEAQLNTQRMQASGFGSRTHKWLASYYRCWLRTNNNNKKTKCAFSPSCHQISSNPDDLFLCLYFLCISTHEELLNVCFSNVLHMGIFLITCEPQTLLLTAKNFWEEWVSCPCKLQRQLTGKHVV